MEKEDRGAEMLCGQLSFHLKITNGRAIIFFAFSLSGVISAREQSGCCGRAKKVD
jgi:hypothetical protein